MKIWILYVSGNYDIAVFMSAKKSECQKYKKELSDRGVMASMRIICYDFANNDSFELECS